MTRTRFHLVGAFPGGAPVERVDVLQHREHLRAGHLLVDRARQMSRREMRLAEQNKDDGIRMPLADLRNFGGRVAVASADLAQIFARHAVETIERFRVIARGHKQFVKRRPVVSPIKIEADALPQFALLDLTPPPFIEDVLVASKYGFDSEHDGTVADQRALLEQGCGMSLRRRQRVIVADQNHVGGMQSILNLLGIEQRIVAAECLVELAKIFSAAVRILGANFALHSRQRVPLRCAAAGSKIRR